MERPGRELGAEQALDVVVFLFDRRGRFTDERVRALANWALTGLGSLAQPLSLGGMSSMRRCEERWGARVR